MVERVFYAPGRVEIGGNHTDHQHGRVLAAAVDLGISCRASVNGSNIINISSDGFGNITVDITDLAPRHDDMGTTAALVRGVAAWFRSHGYPIGGFTGHVTSNLPVGIGLSSSAAFEVLVGSVIRGLFNAEASDLEVALAGQYAENLYFGKPSGLMDQVASSCGGLDMIDFLDPENPVLTPVNARFAGHRMCIVSTGGSHVDLTDDYGAIPLEMRTVAASFGKEFLRDVDPDEFFASLGDLRSLGGLRNLGGPRGLRGLRGLSDRAVLRAIHFFGENERVARQAEALKIGDLTEFFRLIAESGRSSLAYLQNIYSPTHPEKQALTLALALCDRVLRGNGAYRVHGGGFQGTVLAFVPEGMVKDFEGQMLAVFGEGCCYFLDINQKGVREEGI